MSRPAFADTFTVTPRTWLLFDDIVAKQTYTTNGGHFSLSGSPYEILTKGASLSYRSDNILPSTTFTLTGLYGTANNSLLTRGFSVRTAANGKDFLITSLQTARQKIRRTDIELTGQTRINDLLSWIAGVRYEGTRAQTVSTVIAQSSNPYTGVLNPPVTSVVGPFTRGYDLYTARLGLAATAPLSESGTNLVYANALVFGGHRFEHGSGSPIFGPATVVGPDLTVGFVHRFGKRIALDMRYRALVVFFVSGSGGELKSPKTTHGPNVGLTFRF